MTGAEAEAVAWADLAAARFAWSVRPTEAASQALNDALAKYGSVRAEAGTDAWEADADQPDQPPYVPGQPWPDYELAAATAGVPNVPGYPPGGFNEPTKEATP